MRYILPLLVSLGLMPSAYAHDQQTLMKSFFSVVMVRGYNADGGLAYGSGVMIGKNEVLTNCHIFRVTKEPWVSQGEDIYRITAVKADRWHDLCLLTTETLPSNPSEVGKSGELQKGQEVYAVGHSGGSASAITSMGNVRSLYDFDHGNIIRSDTRFSLGASGSGLFNSAGQLVGINTFKTIGKVAYYYAVPVDWLEELRKQPDDKFPIIGKTFWEEDEDKKAFFLQMAVPELNEDWPKLAEVSERWTKAEPQSSEAWYELGNAQEKMDRSKEAEEDYRKAVSLNGRNIDALFRIGVIASQKGDKDEVHEIELALMGIDKDIADQFSEAAGCTAQC